jgi:hypothetical protein
MSQLTIKLSDKADALIAQLQKEIFNRRRKKVSPAGVVETLVESGAKSQSDKRFATSWKNLIADIEKAAKVANAHGSKPANLSDAEWALILSHRSRAAATKSSAKPAAKAPARKPAAKTATAKAAVAKTATKTTAKTTAKTAVKTAKPAVKAAAKAAVKSTAAKAKPGTAARNPIRKSAVKESTVKPAAASKPAARSAVRRKAQPSAAAKAGTSSVARRMAKAVSRLSAGGAVAPTTPSSNGAAPLVEVG